MADTLSLANAPTISTRDEPSCPLCGGREKTPYAAGYDYELETCANRWTFVRCKSCSGVWLDPRPDETELSVIYPACYYAYDMSERLHPVIRWGKDTLDKLKFGSILRALDRKPQSYLDIGCGDGRYLRQFAARGVDKDRAVGIDLPSPSIPALRDQGYTVFEGRVEDCEEIAPGSLDLITIFHVIEHVADPVTVLRKLADWLAPGGVLAIETPNLNSWDARLFKSTYWGGYHIPRHWTLFNETSLRRAVESVGLEFVTLRYQTGHSFWLYSLHHHFKYGKSKAGMARWFDPMRSKLFLLFFTGLDILRRTFGARTSAMLMLARKPA
jgi:2-polyprenyl-3-methyl-5-hydroxy-6-metoxy-1,4-benzoquinol methylase